MCVFIHRDWGQFSSLIRSLQKLLLSKNETNHKPNSILCSRKLFAVNDQNNNYYCYGYAKHNEEEKMLGHNGAYLIVLISLIVSCLSFVFRMKSIREGGGLFSLSLDLSPSVSSSSIHIQMKAFSV